MLFNSLSFALFLPLVFGLYWLIGGCGHAGRVTLPCRDGRQGNAEPATRRPFHLWHPFHLQNLFIVAASYVFYGWWDWKFLLLITFTSLWAWASGLAIARLANTPRGYRGGGHYTPNLRHGKR